VAEPKTKKDEYQKALSAYGQAVKEFRKGDFEAAAKAFSAFVEEYKAEPELVDRAKSYLAIAKKRQKKETAGLKSIDDHLAQAVLKLNAGLHEQAVKILEKALEFKEKDGHVNYLLAVAYCRLGETDMGLDFLKKAVQKDKEFSVLARNEADFEPLYEDKKFKLITRLL
jgi:tetratricopeptide (TPR) repeat protein